MFSNISKSLWLLFSSVLICCLIYPLAVWAVGQTFSPFTANGSIVMGPDGKPVGSLLIAQPFTKDEYFWPRPSAASYDASASASSTLAASNYLLRDRVARMLGPIVKYRGGAKTGQLVAPDIEVWFQQDRFQGNSHLVAQWADNHNELAQAWVSADPTHAQYVTDWEKHHEKVVSEWIKQNPGTSQPQPSDLAVVFFE
ncbi:MAG: potassium-transporting ATPase subunit C, partial [Candidatus Binataceae bacterium]